MFHKSAYLTLLLAIGLMIGAAIGEECDADLCVGPGHEYALPSEAARHARDGQTVGILAGNYEDCAVWRTSVSIRGIGGRPHIHDKICGRKAVWITQGAHIEIENVELSGGRTSAGTGNAIRHEGGTLILRDVVIHGNQVGIMTNHREEQALEVYDSHFYGQHAGRRLAHSIYAGRIGRFVAMGNYLHDGRSGHFIKTVANDNHIAYNQIVDEHGTDTHLVDIWACSKTVVVGNVLVKTGTSGNLNFIGLTPRRSRGELLPCPDAEDRFAAIAYNTAVFTGPRPLWSTLVQHRHIPEVPWEVSNNLAVHVGRLTRTPDDGEPPGRVAGNVHHEDSRPELFRDPERHDFRPAQPPGGSTASAIVPLHEFAAPRGTRSRDSVDNVGAHAYESDR
ncbi:hypothetical protein B1C78_13315 [Thioalkalivibrio denitrificans]|uniref:Right handed beta helix domain-containing protein n=1 Tax=Thioalkalivibrio denitrificans TaxID=108003 RepID=A0A1V3NCT4_9GAMM|nr:hypothetical protein [Thioalkalivibrio denitrificans]OOG22907.1 hypothetical protein B1C78_13315 [Thioalkalivibrio denitrificans]